MAITVCILACILNSFVCCGEFSGCFVLYVKNVRDGCSSLCVLTLLTGMDSKQRRGRSSKCRGCVHFFSCRPPRASFAFLPLAGKRVCCCVRCTCSLLRQQIVLAGFLGFARGHEQAVTLEPGLGSQIRQPKTYRAGCGRGGSHTEPQGLIQDALPGEEQTKVFCELALSLLIV